LIDVANLQDNGLQAASTLALGKFMCVSCTFPLALIFTLTNVYQADFCDAQLPLFLAIMERSKNPIIRSNAVIALGDMVLLFFPLILMSLDSLFQSINRRKH